MEEGIVSEKPIDLVTVHNTVTDILMRNFMPKQFQSQIDEILVRRGVATVTDEIMAIVEQYYMTGENHG